MNLFKYFLVFVGFSSQLAMAITPEELVTFWGENRYKGCDGIFYTEMALRNTMSLNKHLSGICEGVDLKNIKNKKTFECFKSLDKTLEISIQNLSKKPSTYECKSNPAYAEYLENGGKEITPEVVLPSASVSCFDAESKKPFLYAAVEGTATCTKKFNCRNDFKFGESKLDSGTYYLRCHQNPQSQSDCDEMNLNACEGQEVSYSKISFGGLMKASPVKVNPSGNGSSAK